MGAGVRPNGNVAHHERQRQEEAKAVGTKAGDGGPSTKNSNDRRKGNRQRGASPLAARPERRSVPSAVVCRIRRFASARISCKNNEKNQNEGNRRHKKR